MLMVSVSQEVVLESSQSPHLFVKTLLELSTLRIHCTFAFNFLCVLVTSVAHHGVGESAYVHLKYSTPMT